VSRADPINIVTGADDAFAMPRGVTLYSALSNLERGRSVSLYIIWTEASVGGTGRSSLMC
jgi:lipopolysaccharide biosynthesis glycosyltransferase